MRRYGRLLIAALLSSGCSSGTTPGAGKDTATPGDDIWWGPIDTIADSTPIDAPSPDVPAGDPDVPDSLGEVDGSGAGICRVEGGFGCPCEGPDDCLEGWCVDSPDGQVCTKTCLEECPQGWDCVQVDTGADPVFICLPRHLWICRPCTASAQCSEGLPPSEDRCVGLGAEGAFCGGACAVDEDCPGGYLCQEKETVEGGFSQQCVPEDGTCECAQKHTEAGSATFCQNLNEFGACDGERSCTPDGLSDCEGPVPAQELCNGEDENCDGEIDEDVIPSECGIPGEFGDCIGLTECVDGVEICVGEEASVEECNGLDDDCDGETDEDFTDTDEDGLANCIDPDDDNDDVLDDVDNCPLTPNPDQGDVDGNGLGDACDEDSDGDGDLDNTDCAPLDPLVFTGAQENCLTEYDDNCDGITNEENGVGCSAFYLDEDEDGVGVEVFLCLCAPQDAYTASVLGDCDDTDPKVYPGATEICETEWDDDCDGEPNEEGAPGCVGHFLDEDQDGFGVGDPYCLCTGSGAVNATIAGDCADDDEDVFPGAEELCDGKDNNCDEQIDEIYPDSDGDGMVDCIDPDDDNDGYADELDCQPYNPNIPSCLNKVCGDDGCGGSCGVCPAGSECQNGQCSCVPDCSGKQCGSDGCGGSCGTCPPSYVCQDNICECLPSCGGKQCGADGCGGSCGSCDPGHLCQNGWCICQPNCAGKQCGSDGCGGDCGTCQVGWTCNASGTCENAQQNPCGTIDYAGICNNNTLMYCHAPNNTGSPCYTPPSCQLYAQDCDLSCAMSGYSWGICSCGVEIICPPTDPWCCFCNCY